MARGGRASQRRGVVEGFARSPTTPGKLRLATKLRRAVKRVYVL